MPPVVRARADGLCIASYVFFVPISCGLGVQLHDGMVGVVGVVASPIVWGVGW
jgi:hypothetical protein